jgi:aminomethyltransferase
MENPVENKTILNQTHRDMGARMVPFGGWDMPVHYGSQIEEHHAVRKDAGMFDVCHMTVIDLRGSGVQDFLGWLLANDIGKLKTPGKALYSCMLLKNGCVIDDLIVYYMADDWYRMVVNAATTDKDITWMKERADGHELTLQPRRDLGMIAVQGPNARDKTLPLLPDELRQAAGDLEPFSACTNGDWFVGRTGYTGEDGFEIMLPEDQVVPLWLSLAEAGVHPCGLGARDTLRLEAGMNLYGQDMDEDTTPLESGLAWTVSFTGLRDFIGRSSLVVQKNLGDIPRFTGLVLEGKGVLRGHQKLYEGEREVGEITSGGYSPTLEKSIGLARIAADAGEELHVDIRGRKLPVTLVSPPFVRNGKPLI